MKKIISLATLVMVTQLAPITSYAELREVMKDASGSGQTEQQAIASALLTAVQSVNGTSVSPSVDMATEVESVTSQNGWSYKGKSSPVFSVNTETSGSVNRFQVLSVSGSGKAYKAKVRAYISKFQSNVNDQKQRRMAVMPFQVTDNNFELTNSSSPYAFSTDVADQIGVKLGNSRRLSLLSRDYIDEMASENEFLRWDGSASEMARIGQKVGADYLLVGRISEAHAVERAGFYGASSGVQESVKLNWRVIESSTGKIVASGNSNKMINPNSAMGSLIASGSPASTAEILADQVSEDVLVGLSLKSKALKVADAPAVEEPMSPGSSDKPVKW